MEAAPDGGERLGVLWLGAADGKGGFDGYQYRTGLFQEYLQKLVGLARRPGPRCGGRYRRSFVEALEEGVERLFMRFAAFQARHDEKAETAQRLRDPIHVGAARPER